MNADDLGLAAGVDRGILEAHDAGAVSSASMLVTLDDFEPAAGLARAAPSLGVGLHLDLVLGRPVTSARSLIDPRTGAFRPLGALARRAFSRRIDPSDVEAECAAQIARLRRAGFAVTHLDSHRHAHCLPGVWPAVLRASREAGITALRVPLESIRMNAWDVAATAKKLALAASFRIASRGTPAPPPMRFAGISLQGGANFAQRLRRFLLAPPPGRTELMVHPGYDDPELARLDPYRTARELELRELTSPALRQALRRVGLTHFGARASAQ